MSDHVRLHNLRIGWILGDNHLVTTLGDHVAVAFVVTRLSDLNWNWCLTFSQVLNLEFLRTLG